MKTKSNKTFEKFGEKLLFNENLSKYSWFNLGGPAEYLFKPENKDQLIDFLKENKIINFRLLKKVSEIAERRLKFFFDMVNIQISFRYATHLRTRSMSIW